MFKKDVNYKENQINNENSNKNSQKFFKQENDHTLLKKNLLAAFEFCRNTIVYGASNKITDFLKTNGRVLTHRLRYENPGFYVKYKDVEDLKKALKIKIDDPLFNAKFDPQQNKLVNTINMNKWYFSGAALDSTFTSNSIYLKPRFSNVSPLDDPQFNLNPKLKEMLKFALFAIEKRQGNCQDQACVVAKYLWEHNEGIESIEVVKANTLDHSFVIVNRNNGSDLHNSNTWGNACWIVDPWYGKIFHATQFQNKMNEIKKFDFIQTNDFKTIFGKASNPPIMNKNETIDKCLYVINPKQDCYPTYSKDNPAISVFQPLEYYYEVCNGYPLELHNGEGDISAVEHALDEHKEKFNECLNAIKMRK